MQHGFAAVAEARGFHSHGFQDAANIVHYQRGQGFAFHVFSDNQQRAAGFGHLLQHRQQVANIADFFVKQQNKRAVQFGQLFFRVVNEIGGEVAAVELHAFYHFHFVFQRFAVFHGDHTFFAHFVHGLGDDVADGFVGVGGNRSHLGDFLGFLRHGLGNILQLGHQGGHGFVDTAFQVGRVHACGNVFHAFGHDGLCQHSSGGGTVAGYVVGFGGNFFHHLRAHVFKLVFQFDFFGHGHAVFGDVRAAESTVEHHIAAFRAEGYFHSVRQNVYAVYHLLADFIAKLYIFCCHVYDS